MIRREHQRFSLRKYKVGVASVFLGFGLSFVLAGSGEAKAAETNAETATPKTEVTAKPEASATTAAPTSTSKRPCSSTPRQPSTSSTTPCCAGAVPTIACSSGTQPR